MYAGHLATGLALKAKEPKAPMWGLLVGVGLLDLLFGPFVLASIERVSITPDIPPGFSLDYIDWSHSLLMSLVWSLVYAALFLRLGRRIAAFMGFAVFSHFLLDLPVHPRDLALWPGSSSHMGFGLWQLLPRGWWFIELILVLGLGAYYVARARASETFGRRPIAAVAVVVVLHVLNSPWLSVT